MNKLIIPFFIIISLFISACSSAMLPFSFEKTYYEVRTRWRN